MRRLRPLTLTRRHRRGPDAVRELIAAVEAAARANQPGIVVVPGTGVRRATAQRSLEVAASQHGFAVTLLNGDGHPPSPWHGGRHQVLLVDRCTPGHAVCWIRALGDGSPRRHVVVLFGRLAALTGASGRDSDDWRRRLEQIARRVRLAIERRALDDAEAAVRCAVAEALLRRAPVPDVIERCAAEVELWGGLPPGLAGARGPVSVEVAGVRAVAAWTRGLSREAARAEAALERRARAGDVEAGRWCRLLALLRPSSPAWRSVRASAAALGREASRAEAPATWARLARIVCARVGAEVGDRAASRQSAMAGAAGSGVEAARAIDALAGRGRMDILDGLAGLLHAIEEAEDEAAALSAGCRWLRRVPASDAVAIVSADGTRLVAASGWKTADLSGEIATILNGPAGDVRRASADNRAGAFGISVRYGGTTLGYVVVKGDDSQRPALQQGALTLAAVCGSALRARLEAHDLAARARDCAPDILGTSPAIADVRAAIARAAPTSFPVLIEGESGTGKELVARALHRLSPRRDRRMAAVNCAALTDELFEAELFGHARGAFTGAVAPRTGLLEEAHGGTIFLDEVADLSARGQAKLLRALQEREIRRLGENAVRPIDVRAIAATNVPLSEAVAAGRFRDDLRFRLSVVRIVVPPLRDRLEDLPTLVWTFWRRAAVEARKQAVLGPDALARLARHEWRGNVRELQNVVAGLAVVAPARGRVTGRHVEQVLASGSAAAETAGVPLEHARRAFERRVVAAALARHAGRRGAAAAELGLTRQGLTKAVRRLGLDRGEPEAGVA